MQIAPAPSLQAYIKHYLFLKATSITGTNRLRFFADGNTGIVFSPQLMNSGVALPAALVYGQMNTFQDLYCAAPVEMMIVVLQPFGLYHLFNIPPSEIGQQGIALSELLGREADRLCEQVSHTNNIIDKIAVFETAIKTLITDTAPAAIEKVVGYISAEKGQLNMATLCAYTGWNERKLERHFSTHIGISPKKYTDLVRLQSFIKQLKISRNLTAASYAAGYYDQPHLIRTFRKHTGLTPTQYLHTNPLAVNFVSI